MSSFPQRIFEIAELKSVLPDNVKHDTLDNLENI